jgi:hypothetical protein
MSYSIKCPNCGTDCFPEMVDIGVGYEQVEPAYCDQCGWIQDCPHKDEGNCGKCKSHAICHPPQPAEKSAAIRGLMDALMGTDTRRDIQNSQCVSCKGLAKDFRDAISRKEFTISGLCQECQDKVFTGE